MRSARVTPNTVGYPSDYNALVNDAAGAAGLLAHQMYGTIALPTNPTNGQTLTLDINGTNVLITFVTAIGSTAGNVLIGASAAATVANLIQLLLNPTISNSTQVAIGTNTSANVTLINNINWSASGTSIIPSSFNATLYAPASSFSASTTATGGSYTANTMALYVEPGVFYIAGARVIFTGGVTPTVTAPSSHPRIDVLSINASGTLSWTTGTENASPVAPTYPNPATNLVLCELYNVTGETQLFDNANQTSAQGYISNDVRTFIQPSMNWGGFTADLIPDADATRNLGSLSKEWSNGYFKTNVFVNGNPIASARYGGTGTDGALSVISGTTTLSLGSAAYFEKNYSSIAITGTGALAFSSPSATLGASIVLRSQGNVAITSSATRAIDLRALGGGLGTGFAGVGGAGGAGGGGGGSTAGPGTTAASSIVGGGTVNCIGGQGGQTLPPLSGFIRIALPGGNGAAGAGAAGAGGGGLYIECGGAYNFTGTIDASGANGSTGSSGGGAGAGGNILVLYASLTADSGTYTVNGGTGGTASGGTGFTAGGNAAAGTTLRAVNNYHA
jgi:hypothetical protein